MPLTKSTTLANGITIAYWREDPIKINVIAGTIWFVYNGYIDKAAFTGGKEPVMQKPFTMSLPTGYITMTIADLVIAMRDYAKTQLDFTGATNAT